MTATRALLLLVFALAQVACTSLSTKDQTRVDALVSAARSTENTCGRDDACARPSPLLALGLRASGEAPAAAGATPDTASSAMPPAPPSRPQHYALILDYGQDALLARLDLIRGATRSIDVQTYIFDEDDAGHLVLDELLAAAHRGVKVRLLVDQLAALRHVDTLAALAGAHMNFEMRLYNPVLGRARISYPMYALASACCWRKLNQRMHNKLLVVDGQVAITGGRNYQNDYYDWDTRYNFRDRDILVAGPAIAEIAANFDAFWDAPLSRPLTRLVDVGRLVLRDGVPAVQHPEPEQPRRIELIGRDADDAALVRTRLVDAAIPVLSLRYIGDAPGKHAGSVPTTETPSQMLRELIDSAEERVLLQTPYLVLSKPAQRLFSDLQQRESPPRVVVSTNSLAATDAFIPYALSYKYKRRYLRDFKFEIYEFKPFPQDAPIDVEATGTVGVEWHADGTAVVLGSGASGSGSSRGGSLGVGAEGSRSPDRPIPLAREYSALRYSKRGANEQVPLQRGGVRFGLHAKSMVIDERVGVIGTHNFDPRGENYNTESVVVIEDPTFARVLAASIERDTLPANAWMIARRDKPPVFSGLEYSLAKVSELLPLFDFWPVRYATSYEFTPGPDCPQPISPRDPQFRRCYTPVGDFPEVAPVIRPLTRIFTAFGAGLAPIL
ncbi:MAG: phospholipase D family protein [Xanthomonadales bacterium]|nr:phospholipase D family protein [Xanthomonadales bacterium]